MTADWRRRYAGRTALVTGATGFIGRHLVRALVDAGARVVAVARHPHPADLEGEIITADLSAAGAAAALVARLAPDVTFNLAGYGVDPSERDAPLAERINVALVAELSRACAVPTASDWPGRQLVHAGSALEYGAIGGSLSEESAPAPTTLYGETKLAGTVALQAAVRGVGLRGVVARLFTVYGPGEHPGRLLPSLIAAREARQPLALTSGTQLRDFTWVGDAVEGMLRLGVTQGSEPDVVNVATGTLLSVRAFAERAAGVMGLPIDMLRFGEVPTRAEEMQHEPVSVERLFRACSWRPTTTVEDGVRRTLAALDTGAAR